MQRVGRNRCSQAPITVEQNVADIGINDLLTVGAATDQAIDCDGRESEPGRQRFSARQQAEQQDVRIGKMLAQLAEVGAIPSAVRSGDRP